MGRYGKKFNQKSQNNYQGTKIYHYLLILIGFSIKCLWLIPKQARGGGKAESAHRLVLHSDVLKWKAVGSSNFVTLLYTNKLSF